MTKKKKRKNEKHGIGCPLPSFIMMKAAAAILYFLQRSKDLNWLYSVQCMGNLFMILFLER